MSSAPGSKGGETRAFCGMFKFPVCIPHPRFGRPNAPSSGSHPRRHAAWAHPRDSASGRSLYGPSGRPLPHRLAGHGRPGGPPRDPCDGPRRNASPRLPRPTRSLGDVAFPPNGKVTPFALLFTTMKAPPKYYFDVFQGFWVFDFFTEFEECPFLTCL